MKLLHAASILACIAMATSPARAHPPIAAATPVEAGFQRVTMPDGTEVGIWYPAQGSPSKQRLGLYSQSIVARAGLPSGKHPLIVISHGTGGDFASHVDTALALARAGFVVAALTHPGDNWRDNSRATQVEARPAALSSLVTYMLTAWPAHAAIDSRRIGAFGFSSGGFTVLVAAGGRPDMRRAVDHCAQHPTFFACTLMKAQPHTAPAVWPARDPRIKAIVVAAPALGFAFDRTGLTGVQVPVQLWRADEDRIVPAPYYADAVRAALPVQPEFHGVPDAGHFDFLAPCADPRTVPQICASAPGFDRAAFHARFNAALVRFFTAKLARRRNSSAGSWHLRLRPQPRHGPMTRASPPLSSPRRASASPSNPRGSSR